VRAGPLEAALKGAALVPLEVAEQVAALEPLLARMREIAPAAMHSDLNTARALASAAIEGSRANVAIKPGRDSRSGVPPGDRAEA